MEGESLILVGHGSHLNPDSSAPVYQHAERLRASGRWGEVIEAFWKEEPSLRDALDLVRTSRAVIVPLFLAEGYFTRQVLPRELGLRDHRPDRPAEVFYAAPVGTHPRMDALIVQRAREIVGRPDGPLDDFALVIIGHGTDRSRTSGDTVYSLVEAIRGTGDFGRVECGFLDEDPGIESVIDAIDASNLVLVPFFVAEGWHTRETIPEDLGLTGPVTRREGRTIWYAPPVGTLPEMVEAITDLATIALEGRPLRTGDGDGASVERAEQNFLEWVTGGAPRRVMQVAIEDRGEMGFALRHVDDAATNGQARLHEGPTGGWSGEGPGAPLDDEALRALALAIARFNAEGAYRPLRTAPDLRRGWYFSGLDRSQLLLVLSTLYPAAILRWAQEGRGVLPVVHFEPWAERQTAMYEAVRELAPGQVAEVVRTTCDPCCRLRRWAASAAAPESGDPPADAIAIPCPEPCTVFATEARELAEACRKGRDGPA